MTDARSDSPMDQPDPVAAAPDEPTGEVPAEPAVALSELTAEPPAELTAEPPAEPVLGGPARPNPPRFAEPAAPERSFKAWRGRRPFWGGLLVTLSGAEILVTEKAPLPVILHIGMQGLAGYLVPVMLMVCGLLLILNPAQRIFYSIVAVLLTLGSWITSNLGGFFLGLLLGLVGSTLAFGWLPAQPARRKLLRRRGGSAEAA